MTEERMVKFYAAPSTSPTEYHEAHRLLSEIFYKERNSKRYERKKVKRER
jgi:hypothetical protein